MNAKDYLGDIVDALDGEIGTKGRNLFVAPAGPEDSERILALMGVPSEAVLISEGRPGEPLSTFGNVAGALYPYVDAVVTDKDYAVGYLRAVEAWRHIGNGLTPSTAGWGGLELATGGPTYEGPSETDLHYWRITFRVLINDPVLP